MNVDKILALHNRFESLVSKNHDLLDMVIGGLRDKHAIDSSSALLKQSFDNIENENRLMQIGIVGRVKAGKSSLLNALVFDGEQVLPKAATPMTAALTTLAYGDKLKAEVEFFSPEDVQDFKKKHAEYEIKLSEIANRLREEARKRAKATVGGKPHSALIGDDAFQEKIQRQATRELKVNTALSSAYDQYERIKKSGVDVATLGHAKELTAPDLPHLGKELLAYVGADGKYMPFTKSANIFLPFDKLKDIRIIDTPGLNDPVASRERRTNELLKDCDVVFIVSPSGQFLNHEDLRLMGRITEKEGVHELHIVASQIDNQLFGSERQPRLQDSLNKIVAVLSDYMISTLRTFRKDNPEVGHAFDSLCEQGKSTILYSSAICYYLAEYFDQRESWNEGAFTVWNNLLDAYPDYFSDKNRELSIESLRFVANIDALHEKLNQVRAQKDRIIEERRQSLVQAKAKALEAYRLDLLKFAKEQSKSVKEGNIENLHAERIKLEWMKEEISFSLNDLLKSKKLTLRLNLDDELLRLLDDELDKARSKAQKAARETIRSGERDKSGVINSAARFLGLGGTETYSYSVATVASTQVHYAIEMFVISMGRALSNKSAELLDTWRKDFRFNLIREYRQVVGDETVDERLVISTLVEVANKTPVYRFSTDMPLWESLSAQGTLEGSYAERYIENATKFLNGLQKEFQKLIFNYVSAVEDSLSFDLAERFFKDYDNRLNQLVHQIQNQTEIIDRLGYLERDLQKETI